MKHMKDTNIDQTPNLKTDNKNKKKKNVKKGIEKYL